ncbi:MAG: hypothetical protein H6Q10_664 [Acidobacteria bacterium]|nr:hypothetical protein [Acidobacteriota bacterium]
MKSATLLATTVLFASAALFTACGGGSENATPSQPAAEPAASQPAPAPEPSAAPAASAPVEITDALVNAYMEYQKENMRIVQEYAEKTRKNLESAKGDATKALRQVDLATQYSKEMDEKLAAKRRELGFSEEQFETLRDAASGAATYRMLFNQMGGDKQLAALEAEQKAQIEKLPEADRAAAQAESEKMMQAFKDSRDLVELRKKYGDKSWEVLVRHADALAAQQLAFLQMGKK